MLPLSSGRFPTEQIRYEETQCNRTLGGYVYYFAVYLLSKLIFLQMTESIMECLSIANAEVQLLVSGPPKYLNLLIRTMEISLSTLSNWYVCNMYVCIYL